MRKSTVSPRQKEFLQEIDSTSSFLSLLDSIDGLSFFAKDNDFRLIFANPYFYRRLGLHSEKEILGKNDFELFPEPLARKFRKDDEWVLTRAKPMTGLVELFLTQQGVPAWYQTNKFPIMNRLGKTIGIMGTVQRYEKTGLDLTKDRKIQEVMEQIRRRSTLPHLQPIGALFHMFSQSEHVSRLHPFRWAFKTLPRGRNTSSIATAG